MVPNEDLASLRHRKTGQERRAGSDDSNGITAGVSIDTEVRISRHVQF
jgi:hypothetical protein